MVVKAADVWNWDSPKETVRRNYPWEQMSGGRGIVFDSIKSAALWRLGRRRHFSSRDKYGGHIIWSAMASVAWLSMTAKMFMCV